MNEFELIARYFTASHYGSNVLLGVGDDAAVVDVPNGFNLVTSVDTIVEGVHFPNNSDAGDIAYRALAVNLSDMAAMGAIPKWFTLSLCIPAANESWIAKFSKSLQQLAQQYQVQLIGGDTVKGPLNISIQMLGIVESNRWLVRSGAKPNDLIVVSGVPGEAAGGLQLLLNPPVAQAATDSVNHTTVRPELVEGSHSEHLIKRFLRPTPRIELGRGLRSHASAAMDVSDGLLTDLRKLCAASGCGAQLQLEQLPVSVALNALFATERVQQLKLSGGDDYELLFTIPPQSLSALEDISAIARVPCTVIGNIIQGPGVECFRHHQPVVITDTGFDHFSV